jgi:hypothetical protein
VRRNTLLADVGLAALVAVVVLIISPGLAVTGMIALLVLLICGVSLLVGSRRARRSRVRRVPPAGRPPRPR